MTCSRCDWPDVPLVESTGGVRSGRFVETYECPRCGAQGTISGEAGDHSTWTRSGEVFAQ